MKMELTIDQILRKHLPKPINEAEKNDDINIIKAMMEYADVVKKSNDIHNVSVSFFERWQNN